MRKAVLLAGMFFVFAGIIPTNVSAQTLTDRIESRRQQAREGVNQNIENRCERITFNIDQRIEKYNSNSEKNKNAYLNIKTTVMNLVVKLESQGKNAENLKSLLVKLDEYIAKASSLYETFINQLNNSKAYACGNSEGQFANAIKEANITLSEFRKTVKDINTLIRNEIRPAILEIVQS